jgi:integrase/recombinase XerD
MFLKEVGELESITSLFVREWLNNLDTAPTTKQKHLACLRSFFNWLIEQEGSPISHNPIGKKFKLPKSQNTLHERILTPEEVNELLFAAERVVNRRDYLLIKTLYMLGLRISEGCSLKWRDFHPGKTGTKVTIFGKGGKTRSVSVPAGFWEELVAWQGDVKKGFVFATKSGKALSRTNLHCAIKKAAAAAGLENGEWVSCHWLRHSHATHSLDNGAPIHLVQQSLGHASLETTGKYVHVLGGKGSGDYLQA